MCFPACLAYFQARPEQGLWDTEPPRTVKEDFQALAQGLAPQAPIHWRFNPFEPDSIYKAVKRFHHLFVENSPKP